MAQGKFSLPDTDYLVGTAVAPDGSRVFGALYSVAWSGVAAVDQQGSITRIKPFNNPQEDSISVAFDGRWLVWSERHALQDLAADDLRAWDSTTGEVFDIFTGPVVGGSRVSQLSIGAPVVSQGQVALERQPGNLDAPNELHLYSLATREDRVVSNGKQVFPILFWRSKLLVSERDTSESGGHFAMVDAVTGEPSALTEPFAAIPPGDHLAATGDLVAWSDGNSVSIRRTGETAPTRIVVAARGDSVQYVEIAGNLVEWGSVKGPMAADLRSGSVTLLLNGNGYGSAYPNGDALLLSELVGTVVKSKYPFPGNVIPPDVVDTAKLAPLPGCPS